MKKTVPFCLRLPDDLKKDLQEFCEKYGLSMTHIMCVAVRNLLKRLKETEEDVVLANERILGEFEGEETYHKHLKERGIDV